ncbi:MAG: glycosyltransferase, partial [Bacteroidales bacterium]
KRIYDAIYTGGITKRRGAMKILEATKIAVKQEPGLKILFLGTYFPSELKDEMNDFLIANGLVNNVILHDPVPYSEVSGFYSRSKTGLGIFLPIPTHRIILQIKIFEYMNYGLPIIGSNFGHIKNYIENNNSGITVNPENPEEIANALIMLLKDRNLYDQLSKNGIKAVDEKYQWKFMEKKLISIYENLLNDQA